MEIAEERSTSMQLVSFTIANEDYGIEILKVQEILKLPPVTKLPKSADYIIGVFDLRGRVIPVIDLGRRFKLYSDERSHGMRAVVVEIRDKQVALSIDSVSHVVKIDSKDIEPPPPIIKGISGRYITGIGKLKDGYIVILDIDQIFSSEELKEI